MRLYFEPWLDGLTHATEAAPGVWDDAAHTPMSLLANVCDCIQDFRLCPMIRVPDHVDQRLLRTLRALVARFRCPCPPHVQWRFMPMSGVQNAAFYELLRRYAPLFPQRTDGEPRVPMAPIFVRGRRRHRYPRPRPLALPLLPCMYNNMLVLDPNNTSMEQEFWQLDTEPHERLEGWEDMDMDHASTLWAWSDDEDDDGEEGEEDEEDGEDEVEEMDQSGH